MAKIKEIMTKECVTATQTDTIFDTAKKMKDHDIGFIPIVDGKKLVGVVTDRDLVIRGYAEQKDGQTQIRDVCSKETTSVGLDMDVEDAAKLMARQQIRRLLVVDNGELAGVVAIGDLAVNELHDEKAGKALSEISESDKTVARV
jgi:CBS domain-containing protein